MWIKLSFAFFDSFTARAQSKHCAPCFPVHLSYFCHGFLHGFIWIFFIVSSSSSGEGGLFQTICGVNDRRCVCVSFWMSVTGGFHGEGQGL